MLTSISNHTAVNISNKIFVVGGFSKSVFSSCEDFDSVARKFTSFKILQDWTRNLNARQTVSVGYNIYVSVEEETNEVKVHSFDVKNYVIKHKANLYLENTKSFNCTKVSMY